MAGQRPTDLFTDNLEARHDQETGIHELVDTVKQLAGARSVFVITHDMEVTRQLDRVLVFSRIPRAGEHGAGALIAEGTHEDLLRACDFASPTLGAFVRLGLLSVERCGFRIAPGFNRV